VIPSSMVTSMQALLDKQAITETLHRYCRGMDRADSDILASAYWPDAYEEHTEMHQGPVAEFIKWSTHLVRPMRTAHLLSNIMIDLDNESHARSESYVWAYHSMLLVSGEREDVISGVRYLDHLEKREGDWKIIRRKLVLDYFTKQAAAVDLGIFGQLKITGRKDREDPLYAHQPRNK
jgi:hypothetical protein